MIRQLRPYVDAFMELKPIEEMQKTNGSGANAQQDRAGASSAAAVSNTNAVGSHNNNNTSSTPVPNQTSKLQENN